MSIDSSNNLHLVGSVPLGTAREVFETCAAAIGAHLSAIPDGEVGDRSTWVVFQAYRIFDGHPQLDTLHRPQKGPNHWIPGGIDDLQRFRVKPGVKQVFFENLRYAQHAVDSYQDFIALRREGKIRKGVRFQVSLPTPHGAAGWWFCEPGDYEKVYPAYQKAMIREVEMICNRIPLEDLAIQWDVCREVLEIEGFEFPNSMSDDPAKSWIEQVKAISPGIPENVELGYHFCYADLGHRHIVQPKNLGLSVRMCNEAVEYSGRRVDWVHVPVPRERTDDVYFAPLRDLRARHSRVYVGLIHHTDGVEGTRKRMATARKYLQGFGVATECGFGRRNPQTLKELLEIHRTIADSLD